MTLDVVAFWILAFVLVGAGLAVVLSKNLFHCVLWLAAALVGTAGLFLTLDAEFLAGVQILLYTGGVVTVVVFAIVVTERLVGVKLSQTSRNVTGGAVAALALLASLLNVFRRLPLDLPKPAMAGDLTRQMGESLLTQFALPFELLGVLLLAGLLAATYFARPEE